MTGEDSGTGSLSNQPSDSGSQTDKVSHGSSDSGIHKNHDNPDALEGLLKDNTSGIYDKMLVSDDYDFGSGSTGGVIIKIEDQDHYACEKIDNDSCSRQSNESINASDMHIELKNSVVNSNCSGQSQEDTINCDKRNVRSEDNNTGVVSLSNIDDTLSESSDVEANHKQRLADIMYVSEDDLHMSVSESNEAPGYSKADKISLDSSDCDIDSALMGDSANSGVLKSETTTCDLSPSIEHSNLFMSNQLPDTQEQIVAKQLESNQYNSDDNNVQSDNKTETQASISNQQTQSVKSKQNSGLRKNDNYTKVTQLGSDIWESRSGSS